MRFKFSMRQFLNFLNTLIVFTALGCFPIVLVITYQFDRITSKKLNDIHTLFLKIDESNQKQLMFHKSEYSHYVLITSEEYTKALHDVIACYEACLKKLKLTEAEYKQKQKNLKIFKAAQMHRLETLNNINKEYNNKMKQINYLIDVDNEDMDEIQQMNLTSELEKLKSVKTEITK